ncbi:MAG: TetR/AcrR family transcriptional regulator [Cohaesibacter sp.]|nr:TetR/AcrR family transcriptional regulator [Cohaesibacter sp.]
MARKTKEEAEKTYRSLLEAASRLFATQGFNDTTLNQIAKEAGVTRGAFYWHFKDKNDVIEALWEEYAKPVFLPMEDSMLAMSKTDPVGSLRLHCGKIFDEVKSNREFAQILQMVISAVEISPQNTDLTLYLQQEHARMTSLFHAVIKQAEDKGLLREGLDGPTACNGLICLITGMLDKHFLHFDSFTIWKSGSPILDCYLTGILRN